MIRRALAAAVAWSLLLVVPALAQDEAPERGDLYEVITWNVPPAESEAWRTNVERLAGAAETAGVEDSWYMWSGPSSFTLVYPIDNYAALDDPMAFERQFQGTPAEEAFEQTMEAFNEIEVTPLLSEIVERVDSWSYAPEGAEDRMTWAHIDEYWLQPGAMEGFGELAEEFVALLERIDYPYAIDGHRVHFGDVGRLVYVTFVDDLSSFYGENQLDRAIEAAGAQEEWGALLEKFTPLVRRIEHYDVRFEPDLSHVVE